MLQVAAGMKYLHGRGPRGFIHRDLKSLNILVRPLADAPELKYHEGYLNAKVADFGTAKIKNLSTRYSTQPVDVGTLLWMAPEMTGNEDDIDHESEHGSLRKLPCKVDVYSFAIVCAEILTGDEPYAGDEVQLQNVSIHPLGTKLIQVKFRHPYEYLEQIEGSYGDTPFKTDVGKIVGILGRAGTCLDRIGVFIRRPEVII
ncbi:unnamed protein product [Sphagnum compactum]